ncbi:unnamed protein product [Cyprideis torosa]|uniref:Uncharacterized protein n=1 Tax=Cyprideis torosa TaxID=163714 RepID=A0A7R8WDA4_9CRUS|nr:unnamed protein product [Cyprideis torosa]CAG0894489.1 unnamed protein product [Cyprideis torosa]
MEIFQKVREAPNFSPPFLPPWQKKPRGSTRNFENTREPSRSSESVLLDNMALIPFLFDDWEPAPRYNRWPMSTSFGGGLFQNLDRDLQSMLAQTNRLQRALEQRMSAGAAAEKVDNKSDKFQVAVDVSGFRPEELKVRVQDRMVTIEGKHEERQDEHGYISRQFSRRYVVPEGIKMENVTSRISNEGVLTVTAPKINAIEPPKDMEVEIQREAIKDK